jgi:hypothetical protein
MPGMSRNNGQRRLRKFVFLPSAIMVEGKVYKRCYYSIVNLANAVIKVVHNKCNVYKAEKECGMPWSTLKDHVSHHVAENNGMEKDMPVDPKTWPSIRGTKIR